MAVGQPWWEPEHNLATEMNSFRMSAGKRTLNRTFIGMHVDFITIGVEYLTHIMCVFFSSILFILKAPLRKKDLRTDSRQDTVHCTN